MNILVTGAKGMIGSYLVKALLKAGYQVVGVDRGADCYNACGYKHIEADLGIKSSVQALIISEHIDKVIHLAGLAHESKDKKYTWSDYERINVEASKNVFEAACNIPVLFISTVDVYGFSSGDYVTADTELQPVSLYGRSKALAEFECRKLKQYDIFRFSPVYTAEIKRDIQKRYYLKYPNLAYQIGKGTEYEVLNVTTAASSMVDWCGSVPENSIRILKDSETLKTADCIYAERSQGRAKFVLYFPRWCVIAGYAVLRALTGKNKYTYLLNKAVHPLRSKS